MVELKHNVFGTVGRPIQKEPERKVMQIDDLQSLIELGCIRDCVDIGGKKFCLRSLNTLERLELAKVLKDLESLDNNEKMFSFNIKLLSLCVETVNGIPLEDFHNDKTLDPLQRKQELLSMLQSPVLSRLLDLYNDIADRCDAQFKPEEIKK